MLLGLQEPELEKFVERIAATAIVNQAVVKCLARNIPVTPDNVILFVGDFASPTRPGFPGMIDAIMKAVEEVAIDTRPKGQPN